MSKTEVHTLSGDSSNGDSKIDLDEIWINEFTEKSAQDFRAAMLSHVNKLNDDNRPVIVYIDSYGGAVDSLVKMLETMDSVPNPIITVCMGKAMSCGAVLLSHGDIRFCGQHSRVMVHEVSSFAFGDVHDIENNAKESSRLNRYIMGLLARNCDIEGGYNGLRRTIKDHDGREIWMDAKAALRFGIVDNIGIPVVESVTKFETTVFKKDHNRENE